MKHKLNDCVIKVVSFLVLITGRAHSRIMVSYVRYAASDISVIETICFDAHFVILATLRSTHKVL